MKKLLALVTLLIILSCKEDQLTHMDTGLLTGYDYRMCACCGGTYIEIGNTTYRFFEVPAGSNVKLTSTTVFPVKVKVNWSLSTSGCGAPNPAYSSVRLIDVKKMTLSIF